MWIFTNNAYLSVVKHRNLPETFLVRSRRAGDIARVFPQVEEIETVHADYRYRAHVSTAELMNAMLEQINRITYDNFKNSVKDHDRHTLYSRVWGVLYDDQSRRLGMRPRNSYYDRDLFDPAYPVETGGYTVDELDYDEQIEYPSGPTLAYDAEDEEDRELLKAGMA